MLKITGNAIQLEHTGAVVSESHTRFNVQSVTIRSLSINLLMYTGRQPHGHEQMLSCPLLVFNSKLEPSLTVPVCRFDKVCHRLRLFMTVVVVMVMWVIRESHIIHSVNATTFITSLKGSLTRHLAHVKSLNKSVNMVRITYHTPSHHVRICRGSGAASLNLVARRFDHNWVLKGTC